MQSSQGVNCANLRGFVSGSYGPCLTTIDVYAVNSHLCMYKSPSTHEVTSAAMHLLGAPLRYYRHGTRNERLHDSEELRFLCANRPLFTVIHPAMKSVHSAHRAIIDLRGRGTPERVVLSKWLEKAGWNELAAETIETWVESGG